MSGNVFGHNIFGRGRRRYLFMAAVCVAVVLMASTMLESAQDIEQKASASSKVYGANQELGAMAGNPKTRVEPLPQGESWKDKIPHTVTWGKHGNHDATPKKTMLESECILHPDGTTSGERVKIGKVMMEFGEQSRLYDRALRTHERHNKLHNYSLYVLRYPLLDGVWAKAAYLEFVLLREMKKPEPERLRWLFWVDLDTIIMNPLMPIETLLPPEDPEWDDIHLLVAHDWNGLNAGVLLIRVSDWSVEFFSAVVSYRFFNPDADLPYAGQSAIEHLIQDERLSWGVIQTPQRWFNAYQPKFKTDTVDVGQARRGDMLVHFPRNDERDERMLQWLEVAEQRQWDIEVENTQFPKETADFWAEQKEKRKEHKREAEELRSEMEIYLDDVDKLASGFGDDLEQDVKMALQDRLAKARSAMTEQKTTNNVQKLQREFHNVKEAVKRLTELSEELGGLGEERVKKEQELKKAKAQNSQEIQKTREAIPSLRELLNNGSQYSKDIAENRTSGENKATTRNMTITEGPEASEVPVR